MIRPPSRPLPCRARWLLLPLAGLSLLPSCRKAEIQTYIAPKDGEMRAVPASAAPGEPPAPREIPRIGYTVPAGWTDIGRDDMNAARLTLPPSMGDAYVSVTPLALMAGQEASLVNMWRQVTEQPPLSEEDAGKALSEVEIAGQKGSLFEVLGKRASEESKIVTAFLHRDDKSWFFKLQGEPAAVDGGKPAFLEFLKGVRFDAPAPPPVAPAPQAPTSEFASSEGLVGVPGGTPAGWTALAPGAMQAAKFSVPETDGAKAEVMVSIFPSDTGGAASNVSRWRGQLGLPAAEAAELNALIKPLPGGPEGAVFVELENDGRSLTGAIVPRGGNWFFYKLLGDTAAVTAARESFLTFCTAGS